MVAKLIIKESLIADVTLLTLEGVLTIAGGARQLRGVVERALGEGRKKLVLDLSGTHYIDSSGLGELVGAIMKVVRTGGRLQIKMPQPLYDIFALVKMLSVFDVIDDINEALPETVVTKRYTFCPVFECGNRLEFSNTLISWAGVCMRCGTTWSLRIPPAGGTDIDEIKAVVGSLSFPTYEDEEVKMTLGDYCKIDVVGRLDRFVYEAFERAWRTLSSPRRVVVDLRHASEITRLGLDALWTLCANAESADQVAVLCAGREAGVTVGRAYNHLLYETVEQAVAALGEQGETSGQSLTINIYEA